MANENSEIKISDFKMSDLAIGIDLGTTNSCVAVYMNNRVKILENSDGGRITPSFIYFTDLEETIVGEHAKRMASGKADCGIYEVKRLVGRKFTDNYLQQNLKYLPFRVEADALNEPVVMIPQRNNICRKTPQELCTIILQKLKKDVEAKIGDVVRKVVITVPAYFNVKQREVTLAAAQAAGFTVLKLLNEPTAAALSYYFENEGDRENYSLVYDLGGGTFDVAVLKRSTGDIEIVGVDGDTQLGGHDFDNLIVNHVCKILTADYDYNSKTDKNNLRRIHNKCEDAKKALSAVQETVITLIGFVKDHPCVQIKFSRKEFEEICEPLFKRTIDIVDNCLECCGIAKHLIKEVIMSGGSTRIPKIQNMLSEYFNGESLNKFVNPDECVAEGAALQAAMLSNSPKQPITSMSLKDVVPLSLGVAMLADEMSFLIKRNTVIPASASITSVNVYNQQTSGGCDIREGERTDAKKNRLIGNLVISNITPAPPGQCEVILTMNVDINGILTVTAKEKFKNNVKELRANYARGDKSETEVKEFLSAAANNKEEDQRFLEFIKYKKYLINYCVAVMYNFKKRSLVNAHNGVYKLCEESEKAGKPMDLKDEARVKELIAEVKLQCEPLVSYYNFDLMPQF